MNSLLEIKDPKFLKDLSIKELEELAQEIRTYIIETVSKTGGHLASSLGTVELVIALHYIFDLPYDRLVFDIGHQAYTHKILTGRAIDFKNLRKKNGIS
ncbi:MAG TPA: 1-deoxy-D-xylulose-5-phosphate synthase N-terminal domain-containing protein, partial [Bacilli bacterium]|nr:1-deoxy-D-xylulose-5-phosphate synthase N-terminal domain-containing protein [Bacilli bacterium]